MKIAKILKETKWFLLFGILVISIKLIADLYGYSLWPFQSNDETNTTRQVRSGRNHFYHK